MVFSLRRSNVFSDENIIVKINLAFFYTESIMYEFRKYTYIYIYISKFILYPNSTKLVFIPGCDNLLLSIVSTAGVTVFTVFRTDPVDNYVLKPLSYSQEMNRLPCERVKIRKKSHRRSGFQFEKKMFERQSKIREYKHKTSTKIDFFFKYSNTCIIYKNKLEKKIGNLSIFYFR